MEDRPEQELYPDTTTESDGETLECPIIVGAQIENNPIRPQEGPSARRVSAMEESIRTILKKSESGEM